MADSKVEKDLKMLSELLHQQVSLLEHPDEDNTSGSEPNETAALVHTNTPGTEAPGSSSHRSRPVQGDGPVKFEKDEFAPRAKTSGAYDCDGYVVGEPVSADVVFCPWKIAESYPDHFIGKTNRSHAKPYFDKMLQTRVWDFFYLHDFMAPSKQPHLFVPAAQFQLFLDAINKDLGIALTIPAGIQSNRFLMKFGECSTPRPRYLMRTREVDELVIKEYPIAKEKDIEAFKTAASGVRKKVSDMLKLITSSFKNDKNARGYKAAGKQKDRERMLLTTQKLLRLVEGDISESGYVLVCVDVEKIEMDPFPVSELGLAILDTRDIEGVPPGPGGRAWWPFISAHHIRVHEYAALRNERWVLGCPDRFNFGQSVFQYSSNTAGAVAHILSPYTSESREIYLVGHDLERDISAFRDIGFDLRRISSAAHPIDSQLIHQAWRGETQGRSLKMVLTDLGIYGINFHNAGNDAVYTLQGVLAVAIEAVADQAARERGEVHVPALRREREEQLAERKRVDEERKRQAEEGRPDEEGEGSSAA